MRGDSKRTRNGRQCAAGLAACVAVAALSGCTTRWTPTTAEAPIVLQWPYPPNAPKVTYVKSLTGVTRSWTAGSAIRSVLFGTGERDNDAFVLPVSVARGNDGRMAVADVGRQA